MTSIEARTVSPSDAVAQRLDDPAVAAALITLLDNAELISTLVLGLSAMMERSDLMIDSLAETVKDLKDVSESASADLPSVHEMRAIAIDLAAGLPTVQTLLKTSLAEPETIQQLSLFGDAAVEGINQAKTNETRVEGIRGVIRVLRDEEVQRGLGTVVEIMRALGQRMT